MPTLPAELYYAEIDASTAALAAMVDYADPELPIPSCPDWTLKQLATHLGRTQRWAAEIVATRSADFIDPRSVQDGKLPDDPAVRGHWLTTGAGRLIDTLRDAGDAEVWTPGPPAPASFWARRMAHETMVHSADAAAAAGELVSLVPELAADAIDEWLTVVSGPIFGRPDRRAGALPPGASLHVHATDTELGGTGEWLVAHADDGIEVTSAHAKADVAVTGPAAELLLVLLGRRPVTEQGIGVFGDQQLLDAWLSINF